MMLQDRRTASTSLSARVIEYLRGRGHSQAQIARMLHVSEGYVSLVKHKERSLTLDHLELLASALSLPLGAMLLDVTAPRKKLDKRSQEINALTTRLIKLCDKLRDETMTPRKASSRKSA